jgi:hypothetical protein
MPNIINSEWDIMLKGKKRLLEIMSKVVKAKWDIMLNGKKC